MVGKMTLVTGRVQVIGHNTRRQTALKAEITTERTPHRALRRRQRIAAERPKLPVASAGAHTAQQVAAREG